MVKNIFLYNGFVPPCGIFCGGCPVFSREKNNCQGAEQGCKSRKCKGIYVCCVEKKGLDFCYQCKTFPCVRFRKFSETWKKHEQDLIENQNLIINFGKEKFIEAMNNKK